MGILIFGILPHFSAFAQTPTNQDPGASTPSYEEIAPKFLRSKKREPEVKEKKPKEDDVLDEDQALIQELKGIIFLNSEADLIQEGSEETGIVVKGLPNLDNAEFKERVSVFIQKEMSINSLKDLIKFVVEYYRNLDQPVVDVVVPEQEITTGSIQIIVLEGKVGEIKVEGNEWFGDEILLRPIRLKRGNPIYASPLIEDLTLLNKNPFREVDVLFEPGSETGYTDVIIETKDRFPVRFYTGYEDTGNDLTGDERWFVGFNWGNAFFQDHFFSYQATVSSDFEGLRAHSFNYLVPLFRDHELRAFFSASQSQVDFFSGSAESRLDGSNMQTGMRYKFPLPTVDKGLAHGIELGFDYQQTNNDLFTGGTSTFDQLTDVFQWIMAYEARLKDPFGQSNIKFTYYHSPGGWTDKNKDRNFEMARSFADAAYNYYTLRADRSTNLPFDFTLKNSFEIQFADANLLSTEQFALGGHTTVRGYDPSEVRGDEGYFFRTELQTPPFEPSKLFGLKETRDQLYFLVFWDYGVAQNIHLLDGENPDNELSGVGGGLRYQFSRYFSLRADYGFQLLDSGRSPRHDSRWHLGLILSY